MELKHLMFNSTKLAEGLEIGPRYVTDCRVLFIAFENFKKGVLVSKKKNAMFFLKASSPVLWFITRWKLKIAQNNGNTIAF